MTYFIVQWLVQDGVEAIDQLVVEVSSQVFLMSNLHLLRGDPCIFVHSF